MVELGLLERVVMLNLIQNPVISTNALQKAMVDQGYPISYHQISQIISYLQNSGILRPTQEIEDPIVPGRIRYQTEVEGRYNPNALGLRREDLIFRGFQNSADLKRFALLCDLHPYTHYRTFFLDSSMNAYVQFDIPESGGRLMEEFYSKIVAEFSLSGYSKIVEERFSQSLLDLSRWIPGDEQYFSFPDLQQYWETIHVPNGYQVTIWDSQLDKLDELDLFLVRELTINGKVRPKDLAKYYDRDASTLSRRLQKLNQMVMAKMVLEYDRRKFDLTVPLLIIGESKTPAMINKFHKLIDEGFIPFKTFLRSQKEKFIHVAWLPTAFASNYIYFIWEQFGNVQYSSLYLSDKHSWIYPFYNLNYDSEERKWKLSKEYVIDAPLSI